MDSNEKRYLLGKCIHLKLFLWVFAADNFPKLTREGFIIVSASSSQHAGSHWMVLLFHENKVYLADPLGELPDTKLPIIGTNYYCRLIKFYNEVTQILKLKLIQNQYSWTFLHLYCACDVWL